MPDIYSLVLIFKPYLSWGFLGPPVKVGGGGGGGGNGTCFKLDVFYTLVAKEVVTSLLVRNYDVITCTLADA